MAVLVQVFYTVTSVSANYVIAQFYTELWLAYLPLPCALSTDSSLPVVKVAKPRSRRSRLGGRVNGMTLSRWPWPTRFRGTSETGRRCG